MKKEQQDIERLFQEAFKGYEEPVLESDWSRIEQALPQEKKRKRPLWPFILPLPFAAAIALLWFLNQPDSGDHKLQQTAGQIADKPLITTDQAGPKIQNQTRQHSPENHSSVVLGNKVPGTHTGSENESESSAYRRTVAISPRSGSDSESQKVSGTGSNSLGGSTGQINNELREFKGEMSHLRGRNLIKIDFEYPSAKVERLFSEKYKRAEDAWRKARSPSFWLSTTIQSMDLDAPDVKDLEEWKGKSLMRNRLQGGLMQQVSAGVSMNYGLTSVQIGMGESQTLNPMKQHWTLKTRVVTDSIPYRNMPGDTLFWIPVRFSDTLIDVVSEFSERRLIIPFRVNQNIPICAKFGLNFQAGGQFGILQSMKATIPSPYTDYTWTQVRNGMAGTAKTNAPLVSAEADKAVRMRMDVQLGAGAYWRLNRNLTLSGNAIIAKSLNPLFQGSLKSRQYGGQVTLIYQW